jgi:hypothetical protein
METFSIIENFGCEEEEEEEENSPSTISPAIAPAGEERNMTGCMDAVPSRRPIPTAGFSKVLRRSISSKLVLLDTLFGGLTGVENKFEALL